MSGRLWTTSTSYSGVFSERPWTVDNATADNKCCFLSVCVNRLLIVGRRCEACDRRRHIVAAFIRGVTSHALALCRYEFCMHWRRQGTSNRSWCRVTLPAANRVVQLLVMFAFARQGIANEIWRNATFHLSRYCRLKFGFHDPPHRRI